MVKMLLLLMVRARTPQKIKIVIVNEDGTLNKDFHTSDVNMDDSKTVY